MISALNVFNELKRLEGALEYNETTNPGTSADIDQVNDFMSRALMSNGESIAYYIGPNSFSFGSEDAVRDATTHICKRITSENELLNDHYGNELDKPLVFISNVSMHKENISKGEDDLHLVSWILIPKNYKTFCGVGVKNKSNELFFFDPLNKVNFPDRLKRCITEDTEFSEENNNKRIRLRHFCSEHDIVFHDQSCLTGQQIHINDCAWWAMYYVLMAAYTGGLNFLEPLKGKRLSARKIRDVIDLSKYDKHSSHRKGNDYELILAILFLKRSVENGYKFQLATERKIDEKFDDMYVRIGEYIFYLQAKHKESVSKRITYGDLQSQSPSDYSLYKYFNSFLKIKAREDKAIWENVKFMICTTIEFGLDEMKVVDLNDEDGIFKRGDNQTGSRYRIEMSKRIRTDIFKSAYQKLSILSRKLAECIIERKNINVEQLPIIKSFHVALANEVIDVTDTRKAIFRPEFLENSEELSLKAKEFRKIFYEAARDILQEMAKSVQNMYPKKRIQCENILKSYEKVTDEISFWNRMKGMTLPVSGRFGQPKVKNQKVISRFIDELVKKITESSGGDVAFDEITEFENEFYELFGYVLNQENGRVTFDKKFFEASKLPEAFEAFRRRLRNFLETKNFEDFDPFSLNFSFGSHATEKIFKEKVCWELDENCVTEEDIDSEIDDFLNKLVFVVTPKEDILGEVLKQEMRKDFGGREGENVYNALYLEMKDWINSVDEKGKGKYLSHGINPYSDLIEKYTQSVCFKLNKPVASFTGREKDLKSIHSALQNGDNSTTESRKMLVSGMGGIGKSELGRKYAHDYKKFYEGNVIWIDAEAKTLSESFKILAGRLNIDRKCKDGTEKEIDIIVEEVYGYFAHKKCLFIFDNAEEYRELKLFLPNSGTDSANIYFLITSRNRDLFSRQAHSNVQKLALGLLTEEESMKFVEKTIDNSDFLEEDDIRELVRMLGFLPLALQQAVAYINESGYAIDEYITVYRASEEEEKVFLQDALIDSYDRSIYVSFKMAVEKIREKVKMENISLEILYMLAYFSPDNLPKDIFLPLAMQNTKDSFADIKKKRAASMLTRSITLIRQYSLIDIDESGDLLNIHRLVQQVIRLSLREEEKKKSNKQAHKIYGEKEVLYKAMDLLYDYHGWHKISSHLISAWCCASKYGDLIEQFYFKRLDSVGTPLHLLSLGGKHRDIELILDYMQDIHNDQLESIIDAEDRWRDTPLYVAAEHNHLEVVKILVEKGAKLDSKYLNGRTPLWIAQRHDHSDIVDFLAESGADTDVKGVIGWTPSDVSTGSSKVDFVQIIAQDIVSQKLVNNLLNYKLYDAIKDKNLTDLKAVLEGLCEEQYTEVTNSKIGRFTPLMLAAYLGLTDIAEYLMDKGAKMEKTGYTQLHHASREGHLGIVKLLVNRGADPKQVNRGGWTALHIAAHWGHLDIVKYYLEELEGDKSIDVNIGDRYGETPLCGAALFGYLPVVKFLIQKGAIVKPINYDTKCWPSYSSTSERVRMFKKNVLKMKEMEMNYNYDDEDCRPTLKKFDLTALNIAAAFDELGKVKGILDLNFNTTDLQHIKEDITMSMHIAELYGRAEIHKYLVSHYEKFRGNMRPGSSRSLSV